jgi:hypothetical protein
MTRVELARRIGVHPKTISHWVHDKRIAPALQLGRSLGFSEDQIQDAERLRDELCDPDKSRNPYAQATGPDDLFETVDEAAARMERNSRTIHRMIQNGDLTPFRRGKHTVVVLRADVDAQIAKRVTQASAAYAGKDERPRVETDEYCQQHGEDAA